MQKLTCYLQCRVMSDKLFAIVFFIMFVGSLSVHHYYICEEFVVVFMRGLAVFVVVLFVGRLA